MMLKALGGGILPYVSPAFALAKLTQKKKSNDDAPAAKPANATSGMVGLG